MNTTKGDQVQVLQLALHGSPVGYLAGFSNGRNVLSFAREFTSDPGRPAFSLITHPAFPRAEKILSYGQIWCSSSLLKRHSDEWLSPLRHP